MGDGPVLDGVVTAGHRAATTDFHSQEMGAGEHRHDLGDAGSMSVLGEPAEIGQGNPEDDMGRKPANKREDPLTLDQLLSKGVGLGVFNESEARSISHAQTPLSYEDVHYIVDLATQGHLHGDLSPKDLEALSRYPLESRSTQLEEALAGGKAEAAWVREGLDAGLISEGFAREIIR